LAALWSLASAINQKSVLFFLLFAVLSGYDKNSQPEVCSRMHTPALIAFIFGSNCTCPKLAGE